MSLNKNAIETLSISAVRDSITVSEFLQPFINDNDKEPSWDGHVYIYGNKSKKKSDFIGRIAVQIKGKECNNHKNNNISFQMSTVDLRNYLNDGGCILFVVYIGNKGLSKKIYYVELTPMKLRRLLKKTQSQKTKVVTLKEFPSDNTEKATIFLNCWQNCQKQASFIKEDLLTLEDLRKGRSLENITIPFSGFDSEDPKKIIINNDTYIYAKIKGSPILHPVDIISETVYISECFEASITIGEDFFYDHYSVIRSEKETIVKFGDSFNITFVEQENIRKVTYKDSNRIRTLAKDLEFMLMCLKKRFFEVNGEKYKIEYDKENFTEVDIENNQKKLEYIKKIVQVLDILHCTDDIDIQDMKEQDWRNIDYLITALIDKKSITGLKDDLPVISCLTVGKLKFAIYLERDNQEEKGTYRIFDFFKSNRPIELNIKDDKNLPVSQFYILEKEDLLTLNNIDFDTLLPSFKKVTYHEETFRIANAFLLKLLNASDIAKGRRKEKLLDVCYGFSTWIAEASNEEVDYKIRTLNKLQTIKRIRPFDENEINILYKIIGCHDSSEECKVAAYLLLEQQQAAEIHFLNLTKEEQNDFQEYPIYHFWKTENKE